jgi:hypothetical protein
MNNQIGAATFLRLLGAKNPGRSRALSPWQQPRCRLLLAEWRDLRDCSGADGWSDEAARRCAEFKKRGQPSQ